MLRIRNRKTWQVAVAATLGLLLVGGGKASAGIVTTNLFAHYDAGQQTYNNAAKGQNQPPVPSVDGGRIWEWWDQAPEAGNQIIQNNNANLQPILRTGVLNGHNVVDMAPIPGSNIAGLLAIGGSTGTDAFGETMNTNQVSYTAVFKNNNPDATGVLLAFRYDGGVLPGDATNNFLGTRFLGGERISYTHDDDGIQQVVNDASVVGTDWTVLSVVWDGVAGTLSEYVNGELTGTNTNAFNTDSLTLSRYRIGAQIDNAAASRIDGALAELLIYSTALSDADRQATEAFLMEKYALPIPEPATWLLAIVGLMLAMQRSALRG